jgi:cyclase
VSRRVTGTMKQIATDVYLERGYAGGNVGYVDTGEGIVCIDFPMMPSDARHWVTQIEGLRAQPIVAVIQTDFDLPRVLSTNLVGGSLIAHDAVWEPMVRVYGRERMVQRVNEMLGDGSDWQVRMPDVTFTEHLVLKRGSKEIHVLHAGGHSPGTSMVHLPDQRLVFTGDLVFTGRHPTMQYAQSKAWLTALNRLRKMAVDTIVPGHGRVAGKEATYPLSDYIRGIRSVVRRSYRAGRSKSDTSKSVAPQLMDAFPYDRRASDRLTRQIRESCNRIYDEYRALDRAQERRRKRGTR